MAAPRGPAFETGTLAGLLFFWLILTTRHSSPAARLLSTRLAAWKSVSCARLAANAARPATFVRTMIWRVFAKLRFGMPRRSSAFDTSKSYRMRIGCSQSASADEIRRATVAVLRRQRPQIVITFDPDHIAVSRFASDDVSAAAESRWYPETGEPHAFERMLWCGPGRVFDLGAMENVAGRAGVDFLIDISPYRD